MSPNLQRGLERLVRLESLPTRLRSGLRWLLIQERQVGPLTVDERSLAALVPRLFAGEDQAVEDALAIVGRILTRQAR